MDANEYALAHGMRQTRATLERWRGDDWDILGRWLIGAAAIGVLLLAAVVAVASNVEPDLGFHYMPSLPRGPEVEHVAHIVAANSLVLALHAVACVAGFIAGSALPLSTETKTGISRWVHERARPVALAWVVLVTAFSLITQAFALGIFGSTLAESAGISPALLVVTVLPHALLELTAVFLPLAAWIIARRRGDWDQLLAATAVTVTVAIPMLILSAIWEVHVWPEIIRAVSPLA